MNPSTNQSDIEPFDSTRSSQMRENPGCDASGGSSSWILISHLDCSPHQRTFQFDGKTFFVISSEDSLINLLTSDRNIEQIVVDDTISQRERKQWIEITQALAPSISVSHVPDNSEAAEEGNALPISIAPQLIQNTISQFKTTHLADKVVDETSRWQLSSLLTTPQVGEWTWDLDNPVLSVSDHWQELMGLQQCTEVRYQDWVERIHCQDQRGFEIAMDRLLANGNKSMSYEFRKTEQDGFTRWILCRGEISKNSKAGSNILRGFITDITHVRSVDKLTGLGNRSALEARIENWLSQIRAGQSPGMSIVSFNIGNFKLINDCHGHPVGDELLKIIAERLLTILSENPNAFAARINADEFAIVLNGTESTLDAEQLSSRIHNVASQPFQIEDETIYPVFNIGISFTQTGNKSAENLIREASTALYQSKLAGKNEFQFFNLEMLQVAKHKLKLEGEIRKGIENDEFIVHFQPIVDSAQNKMVGAEALIRWEHPTRGLLGPFEFIDLSEESSLIIALGERVLSKCCDEVSKWAKLDAMKGLYCNINVSRKQLNHKDFVNVVKQNIQRAEIDADKIQLEITESAMFDQTINPAGILQALKELNVRVALDDFGTGYSSLSCIHQLPLDTLKIDRSFVKDLETDKAAKTLVEAIITLASGFGLTVCAEGIETVYQKDFFRERNCPIGQGYFYSKPIPSEKLILLAQNNTDWSASE